MAAISEETCPICLESMADPWTTTCNHKFHTRCIDKHIKNSINAKCPLCNKVLYDSDSSSNSSSDSSSDSESNSSSDSSSAELNELKEPLDEIHEIDLLIDRVIDLIDLIAGKLDMVLYTEDPHIKHLLTQSTENENLALIQYFNKIRAELAPMSTVEMLSQFLAIDYIIRTWPNPNLDKNKLTTVRAVILSFDVTPSYSSNELFAYARTFH